jgi:hypothetical protein
MASLLGLPNDVLSAIPWHDSDLWSVALTCRLFYQMFTPALYCHYSADMRRYMMQYPGRDWKRCFGFLRTVGDRIPLALSVREVSLDLRRIRYWDHENF